MELCYHKPRKLGEKPGSNPSLPALRRNHPYQHLNLRLLASRTMRQFLLFQPQWLWYVVMAILANKCSWFPNPAHTCSVTSLWNCSELDSVSARTLRDASETLFLTMEFWLGHSHICACIESNRDFLISDIQWQQGYSN